METSYILKDIGNTKARDLARGLLDRKAGQSGQRKTLKRLLNNIGIEDLKKFDFVLRRDPLFGHVELIEEFPSLAPFDGGGGLSLMPEGQLALDYVAHRVSQNAERICAAFELFGLLNSAIALGDHTSTVYLFETILAEFGHSLAVARKAAVVVGYAPKDTASFRYCTELLSSYGTNSRNYGVMATIDTIADDFNYLDLKSNFRPYASLAESASLVRKVSYLSFNPLSADAAEAMLLVAASSEISLIDATFALLAHVAEGHLDVELPDSVMSSWKELSVMPDSGFLFLAVNTPYSDLHAFRAAPAFLEYGPFRKLRLSLQPLYDLPDSRPLPGSAAQRAAGRFFEHAQEVRDLVPPAEAMFDPLPGGFDVDTAGVLTRSCAVVWVCDRSSDFSKITKSDLASLMGHTFEIDRLLSTEVLRRGSGTATDQFVDLILQTLLRAHSAATKDSYSFKAKFQKYVRQHNDGSILQFVEEVRSLSQNVVNYFISLLDETMLSQMAFLMPSSDAIYETRAELLEWFSDVSGDEVFRSKASQLRLDRKIAAVRGAINETRLNIDGVRFRQWIEQNKLTEFSDFIRQATPNLPAIGDLTDSSKSATRFLTAHREPTMRALQALVQCYEEFCRNSDFGIASFLGRRIRHGTLRGTLLTGLPGPGTGDVPTLVAGPYATWRASFTASIDAFAGRLYFREKAVHKDGLLSAEIHTPQQWQICLVCLKVIYDQGQLDSGIVFVPSLIEQYCWSLFGSELAKGQVSVGEARAKWGTLKLPHSNDEASAAFEKSVNIAVGDQFSTVASWFRKPPNISPVAQLDHVMQVVVREARDEYLTFDPELVFVGDQDLELVGATYYVAYDALTIAVRNAAKHGRHPGQITIVVTVQETGDAKVLEIEVGSLLRADDSFEAAVERINEAGAAGPQDADIFENRSGVRKLQKMRSERRILNFETQRPRTRDDGICVSFTLPFEGIVE